MLVESRENVQLGEVWFVTSDLGISRPVTVGKREHYSFEKGLQPHRHHPLGPWVGDVHPYIPNKTDLPTNYRMVCVVVQPELSMHFL